MPTAFELEERAATGLELPRHKHSLQPDDQPILSIRASVPKAEAEGFIADALHDVRVFMQEHHVRPAGPPFSICRPHGKDLDIETGWPTATKSPVATSRIHSGSLPRFLTGPRDRPGVADAVEGRR